MSFHYKGNIAWSSLPGITSFHNLMYITHNRVYQGCESEGRRGSGEGWQARGSRAPPYVQDRFRQRVPSASARS